MSRFVRLSAALAVALVLSSLSLIQPPSSAAAVANSTQLALLVDGSGSITSADWALQKQGIVAALTDRIAVPLDGSIAVGVVQWSGGSTRVEVPLTLLDGAAAADSVVAAVEAMVQMSGGTNPGDGLRAGSNMLLTDGDADGEWLLCQSTDGALNQGESLTSATAYARNTGVDRYSVIAIEDDGFTRETARSAYGPYVFGGGTVTVARNAAEFANLLIGACLNSPLEVIGIEVTQAVQNWDLDVPLVTGKTTVVRAFVQTADGSQVRTSGLLYGTRDGAPLPGSPLAPQNAGGTVIASGDVAARRDHRGASLNYRLPLTWSDGDVTLRLELPGGAVCAESAPPAGTCEVQLTHVTVPDLAIRPIEVSYVSGGATLAPTTRELYEQALRTKTQFPVAHVSIDPGALGVVLPSAPDLRDVNTLLGTMREDECSYGGCDEDAYWYGVLAGSGGSGLADEIPGRISSGYLAGVGGLSDQGYARNRAPHEIAHTLGRHHAVDGSLGLDDGRKQGYCGELGAPDAPDFPTISTVSGMTVPTLGALGDANSEIWGFDSRFLAGSEALSVVNPRRDLPLMSYGNRGDTCTLTDEGQFRWVSQFTYTGLLDTLRSGVGGGGGGTAPVAQDTLYVSGVIDLTDETARVTSTRLLPSRAVPEEPAGDFALDLLGADGAVLATVPFTPVEMHADWPEPESLSARFNVAVPTIASSGLSRVIVRRGEQVLGETTAGATPPSVRITAPEQGVEQTADTVRIAWEATDPDGDALASSVYYTPDGVSWRALAQGATGSEVIVERNQLAGSDSGRLFVVTSDGLNSRYAEQDQIHIADNAPTLQLLSPTGGEAFSGVQAIFLDAEAFDREDGRLEAISWTSDRDGPLGSGEQVVLEATDLAEGTHTLTATVADSAGLTASQSVEITVYRIAPPEPEDPVCAVDYVVHGTWPTGFTAQVWIHNIGEEPIEGWTLEWDFPGNESVAHHWSTQMTVSGSAVAATNLSWNAGLEPGGQLTFGFTGAIPADESPGVPTVFRLNGTACT